MKKIFNIVVVLSTLLIIACSSNLQKPITPASEILVNSDTFWNYYYNHVNLSDDFVGYDENNKLLNRKEFFSKIALGYYLPISLETQDSIKHYKLYEITTAVDSELRDNIKNALKQDVKFFNMEGKTIPKFDFIDLNAKIYNLKTTKNQLVVLKFWFIGCGACIKEMPALNKLVAKYSNKPNVKFLSLATDTEKQLYDFFEKTIFSYATASVSDDYVVNELEIEAFPTHMLVKNGKILRVVSTEKQLEDVLLRQVKP
ncbi:TlpA family protein disulfide reductase [Pedobacter sp.]|uniref:TlpA family protein disulfide reductase n=1 Tax=Pedobacter sp. TaxID=1411316 RepID=UPI003BA85312